MIVFQICQENGKKFGQKNFPQIVATLKSWFVYRDKGKQKGPENLLDYKGD